MLDEIFVVWIGEFGCILDNNYCGGVIVFGRGYNIDVMNMWFVGGGVKCGVVVGVIDEIGVKVVEVVYLIWDVYVIMFYLLGFDDYRFIYFYGGCFK